MTQALEALEDLWMCLFGQPPCIKAEPAVLAHILVKALPMAPPYQPRAGPGSARVAIYAASPEG